MNRIPVGALWAALVIALVLAASVAPPRDSRAQEPISVAVDADPTGNTATSLGATDGCVSVANGATFDVDITIANVTDLAGWQTTVTFDPSVLVINSVDVEIFLAGTEGSRLVDFSETVPDSSGAHTFIVADTTPLTETGSGTLVWMTLQAVGPGSSVLNAEQVILGDVAATAIGDTNGDSFFDGPVSPAFVYVDAPCPETLPSVTPSIPLPTPPILVFTPEATSPGATVAPSPAGTTPTAADPGEEEPTDGDDNDGIPWPVFAGVAVGAVAIALAGGVWVVRLMRRP